MIAKSEGVIQEVASLYGTKYIIDGELVTPIGTRVRLRTVWVVESHDERYQIWPCTPHLSGYILTSRFLRDLE